MYDSGRYVCICKAWADILQFPKFHKRTPTSFRLWPCHPKSFHTSKALVYACFSEWNFTPATHSWMTVMTVSCKLQILLQSKGGNSLIFPQEFRMFVVKMYTCLTQGCLKLSSLPLRLINHTIFWL